MSATLQTFDAIEELPAAEWDALHDGRNPFVSHAFLAGLERSDSLRPRWGWRPRHAALFDGRRRLLAVAPAYLKDNSHGEFVFDDAWAHAFERARLDYYPKWLVGVPYSPITGPRLLANDADSRARLALALCDVARTQRLSSVHINFLPSSEDEGLDPLRWLSRNDVQFHWSNAGWKDFGEFLDAFVHKRRKAIRQERDKVRRAGFEFRVVHGDEASDADLAAMHAYYCSTFAEKGNSPALTLAFFRHLAKTMPRSLILVFAERERRIAAGALFLRGGDTLYGRYWGSEETAPGLHFETCYYQGIEYCLREGLTRFEPGAQGEHKLARGFLPVLTHSRHWIADPDFAAAIAPWCAEERASVARYRHLLLGHSPFRRDAPPAPPGP